jgi:hypothetical protein
MTMTTKESSDQGAFLRALAREGYEELVDFATQQLGAAKALDAGGARSLAVTLVAEIMSEVAAETAAETAAEAAAQIAAQVRSQEAA